MAIDTKAEKIKFWLVHCMLKLANDYISDEDSKSYDNMSTSNMNIYEIAS